MGTRVVGGALFDVEVGDGHPGLVAVREITYSSISERTLLPFYGRCSVVYGIHADKILGLSKVARLVKAVSRKIQSQQHLTNAIGKAIISATGSPDVAVKSQAVHVYYDRQLVSSVTSFISGKFERDHEAKMEMELLIGNVNKKQSNTEFAAPTAKFKLDRRVYNSIKKAATTLFGDNRVCSPHAKSVKEYSRQMYYATAGHRSVPVVDKEVGVLTKDVCIRSDGGQVHLISCVAPFVSMCEHHLLPFHGNVFIGCSTSDLSFTGQKLYDSVKTVLYQLSHQLQVQEGLTNKLADHVMEQLSVESVVVVCQAVHLCMIARGAEAHSTSTKTVCRRGKLVAELLDMGQDSVEGIYFN